MRLVADPLAQGRQKARLADARFAPDEHDLAFAVAGVAPAVHQQRDFVLAPDQWRHALRPRRLEAADVLGLAKNRPGGNRRLEAFQRLRSEGRQLERAAQQPSRRLGDHHAARLCKPLQSRR
jgi:hypothetical protein